MKKKYKNGSKGFLKIKTLQKLWFFWKEEKSVDNHISAKGWYVWFVSFVDVMNDYLEALDLASNEDGATQVLL